MVAVRTSAFYVRKRTTDIARFSWQSYLSVITLEYVTGKGIVEQLSTGGWVPAVAISTLIGIASVVPLFKGYTNDDWPGEYLKTLRSVFCLCSVFEVGSSHVTYQYVDGNTRNPRISFARYPAARYQ